MKEQNDARKVARASLHRDGYLELEFLEEDITLDKKDVEAGWKEALILDPQKIKAVYLKTAKWSLIDNKAINHVISEIKARPKVAILVHNLSQKLMGNFTLNLLGKSKNTKLFDSDSEARNWLSGIKR
ncbi:MAG TPA: hypothetical protein PLQ93_01965 [Bacteroidia bacterium]|nr:hypothetical protein [Bacteroidia bacterium]